MLVWVLAALSAVLTFLLTPLVRNWAIAHGFVDTPNDARRIHKRPIPRVGGVAIYAGLCVACLAVWAARLAGFENQNAYAAESIWLRLLPAATVIFIVGLIDDLRGITPVQKLLGQIAAASIACAEGIRVTGFSGLELPVWVSIPLTLVWLVACTNAYNLIDGLDGLAAGLALFATLTIMIAGAMRGNYLLTVVTAPLAGALVAFLWYNFNPATIFLGDCGSLMLGFLLGCFGAQWAQKSATLLGLLAPVMALAIPLLDAGLAIVRRTLKGQPLFSADRGHVHHRLLDRGLTPRRAAFLLYGAAGVGAVLSLAMTAAMQSLQASLVIGLFCFAVWFGIQRLGYTEFDIVQRMLLDGSLRWLVHHHVTVRHLRDEIAKEAGVDASLAALAHAAGEMGCHAMRVYSGGSVRSVPLNASGTDTEDLGPVFTVRLPLAKGGYVELDRASGATPHADAISLLASVVAELDASAAAPSARATAAGAS